MFSTGLDLYPREKALEPGAIECVAKSFKFQELLNKVENAPYECSSVH